MWCIWLVFATNMPNIFRILHINWFYSILSVIKYSIRCQILDGEDVHSEEQLTESNVFVCFCQIPVDKWSRLLSFDRCEYTRNGIWTSMVKIQDCCSLAQFRLCTTLHPALRTVLGQFLKQMRKATVRFVMSFGPFVRMDQRYAHHTDCCAVI